MSMNQDRVRTLARYLRDAAFQRWLMQPYLYDRGYSGKIIYAVDNDIIKLFTKPEKDLRYGRMLYDEDEGISIGVNKLLANFIFFKLAQNQKSLLVIPPLDQELREIYLAIEHNVNEFHYRAGEELKALRGQLREQTQELLQIKDSQERWNKLGKLAPNLCKIIARNNTPTEETKKLSYLLSTKTIVSPAVASSSSDYLKEFGDELARGCRMDYALRINELANYWLQLLKKHKNSRTLSIRIERDAYALAYLELYNRILHGKNCKLVMITGDIAMHKAGMDYALGYSGNRSFADLYLRHPRCYLQENAFLAHHTSNNSEQRQINLQDWLDIFLSKLKLDGKHLINNIADASHNDLYLLAKRVIEADASVVDDFRDSWHAYASGVAAQHYDSINSDYISRIGKITSANINNFLRDVGDELQKNITQASNDFFKAATEAGWLLLGNKGPGDLRPRNIPPVYFNTLERMQKFVQSLHAFFQVGDYYTSKYHSEFANLKKKEAGDYMYNMAHALLFAAEGVWHVAAILSKRAYYIASNSEEQYISGREAVYLHAVALRLSAKRVSDLAEVEKYLKLAADCHKKDFANRPGLDAAPIRFEVESIALQMSEKMFGWLRKNDDSANNTLADAGEISDITKNISKLLDEFYKGNIKDPLVRLLLERHLLVNLFMSLALDLNLDYSASSRVGACRSQYLTQFDSFSANIKSHVDIAGKSTVIEPSFLVSVIYNVAELLTVDRNDINRVNNSKKELREHLREKNINVSAVTPYDVRRYEYLLQLSL